MAANDMEPPRKRDCIALVEEDVNGISRAEDNPLVVGRLVHDISSLRSGLLSGIRGTTGVASLPGHLSPEDILIWQTACSVSNAKMRIDELATVIQVADALNDPDDEKWVNQLAEQLMAKDWNKAEESKARGEMLSCLLRLRSDLLQRILYKCYPKHSLRESLQYLPPPLHADLIASVLSHASMPLHVDPEDADHVLGCLRLVQVPAPRLSDLRICFGESIESGAMLALALERHVAIQHVGIDAAAGMNCVTPEWVRSLWKCLPVGGLSSLTSFSIRVLAHPGGCLEVACCLGALPALTAARVTLGLNSVDAFPDVSMSHYTQFASSLSLLPNLEDLTVVEDHDREERLADGSGVHIAKESVSCGSMLLSLITAPKLTELNFEYCPSIIGESSLLDLPKQHFPSLAVVKCQGIPSMECATSLCLQYQERGPPVRSLPGLVCLELCGLCSLSVAVYARAALPAVSDTLTALVLRLERSSSWIMYKYKGRLHRVYNMQCLPSLMHHLGHCTALRHLHLDYPLKHAAKDRGTDMSPEVWSALVSLTKLTCLKILPCWLDCFCPADDDRDSERVESTRFDGQACGHALSRLRSLQHLELGGYGSDAVIEFAPFQPVLAAIAGLQQLTELMLWVKQVAVHEVRDLITRLPSLRDVTFVNTVGSQAERDAVDMSVGRVRICWEG